MRFELNQCNECSLVFLFLFFIVNTQALAIAAAKNTDVNATTPIGYLQNLGRGAAAIRLRLGVPVQYPFLYTSFETQVRPACQNHRRLEIAQVKNCLYTPIIFFVHPTASKIWYIIGLPANITAQGEWGSWNTEILPTPGTPSPGTQILSSWPSNVDATTAWAAVRNNNRMPDRPIHYIRVQRIMDGDVFYLFGTESRETLKFDCIAYNIRTGEMTWEPDVYSPSLGQNSTDILQSPSDLPQTA